MSETNMVKYGSFDLDDADEIDVEMNKSFSGYFKLAVGKNVVRFLPAPAPDLKAFIMVWEHQLNLPNGDFVNFACPRLMGKKRCILCQRADQLKNSGNPADYDRAKDLFTKRRIYANIIDRRDQEGGPKTFAFGKMIWDDLKIVREDVGDYTHPEDGFDIIIRRTGTSKNNTEYKCTAGDACFLGDMEWIGQQGNLLRFTRILSEAEIREKLGGVGEERGGRDNRRERPKRSTVVDSSFDVADLDEDLPHGL